MGMVNLTKCPKGCEINRKEIKFVRTYGPNRTILNRCGKCNYQFSIRRESVFKGFHTEEKTIYRILKALCEGNGIRGTARIFEISTNTVMKILVQAAKHCGKVNEQLISNYHMEECQIDELWTFVKKRKHN
jgi:transposase-like protein